MENMTISKSLRNAKRKEQEDIVREIIKLHTKLGAYPYNVQGHKHIDDFYENVEFAIDRYLNDKVK